MTLEHTGRRGLVHYVLYEKPADAPEKYVLVKWLVIAPGKLERIGIVMIEDDVGVIIRAMEDYGFVWLQRDPTDDPVIMGVYI